MTLRQASSFSSVVPPNGLALTGTSLKKPDALEPDNSGLSPSPFSNTSEPVQLAQLVFFVDSNQNAGQGYITTTGTVSTARHVTNPDISFSQERPVQIPRNSVRIIQSTTDPALPTRNVTLQEIQRYPERFKVAAFEISGGQPTRETQVTSLTQFRGQQGQSGAPVLDTDGNIVGHYSGVQLNRRGETTGYNYTMYGISEPITVQLQP